MENRWRVPLGKWGMEEWFVSGCERLLGREAVYPRRCFSHVRAA